MNIFNGIQWKIINDYALLKDVYVGRRPLQQWTEYQHQLRCST